MHWHQGNSGFRVIITTFKFSNLTEIGVRCKVDLLKVHQDKCDTEVEMASGNYTLKRSDFYHKPREFFIHTQSITYRNSNRFLCLWHKCCPDAGHCLLYLRVGIILIPGHHKHKVTASLIHWHFIGWWSLLVVKCKQASLCDTTWEKNGKISQPGNHKYKCHSRR